MRYQTKQGDSPSRIARAYGLPMSALINANPHKPTHMVAGQRTWDSLTMRETINVPVGGMVGDSFGLGDPAADVVSLLMQAGGPCLKANAGYVCQIQSILGLTVDGKWGSGTAAAVRALVPSAPGACSPTPSWWVKGVSACPSGGGAAPTPSAPPAAGSSLDRAAGAALAALLGDSNYCVSVKRSGTAVNTAIHNFKAAWNAANPTNKVPINTGNYEPIVQIALALALNTAQSNVPPGCGAQPTPVNTVQPTITPSNWLDPCNPANVESVCAVQRSLGITVDGKYGDATSAAARKTDPSAPKGCNPRPTWWKPAGQSNCPGAAPPPPLPPSPLPAPPPAVVEVPGAVLALLGVNPCVQANVETVRNAQRALGLTADGKYGTNTANAARRLLPNAPVACSPTPAWWGAKGTVAPPGPPPPPPPPPQPVIVTPPPCPSGQYRNEAGKCIPNTSQATPPSPPPPPPPPPVVVTPIPGGGGTTIVEEKKWISTGAIVAGAIGALALVGIVAVAASGGKRGARGSSGKRGARGPARRRSSKKRRR